MSGLEKVNLNITAFSSILITDLQIHAWVYWNGGTMSDLYKENDEEKENDFKETDMTEGHADASRTQLSLIHI